MQGHLVSPVLVGRDAEVRTIRSAYDRARRQGPVTLLVTGEAGVGKSRLVESTLAALPAGPLVLTGACLELGADGVPYLPFVAILRELERRLGPAAIDALLPRRSTLTEWLSRAEPDPDGPDTSASTGRARLLADLLTLLGGLATDRPVVLLVEDLHWADASSRELFAYLGRNLTAVPVLLVGTYRTGELPPGHPARQLLGELGRRADVVRVPVEPLTGRAVTEQLTAILGRPADPARARRIHRRSGGNPLFVEALAESGGERADSLRALLLDRVAALPAAARDLLAALAVAGTAAGDELLGEVGGLAAGDLATALRELVERNLVVVAGDGYAIRHDLIREVVYDDLLPVERRTVHRRFAAVLAAGPDPGHPGREAALAGHWFAAGEPGRALPAAWRAAELARRTYAYDEESHLLDRILEAWPRVPDAAGLIGASRLTVLEHAVTAAEATGDTGRGLTHASAAIDELDQAAEPERAAVLLGQRAFFRSRTDGRGLEDLHAALALLSPAAGSARTRGLLLANRSLIELIEDPGGGGRGRAAEALAVAQRTGDELARARALLALSGFENLDGEVTAALVHLAQAREAALACGNHHALLTAVQYEVDTLVLNGEQARAAELARTWWAEADRLGRRRSRGAMLAVNWAQALYVAGRWDEAVEVIEDALADAPPAFFVALLDEWLARIAFARGDWDRLDDLVREIDGIVSGSDWFVHSLRSLPALAALEQGDPERAARIFEPATALPELPQLLFPAARVGATIQRARRLAAPRDRRIAADVAARLAELNRQVAAVAPNSRLQRVQKAWYDAVVGTGGLPAWDRVVAGWRELDRPFELAVALTSAAETALATSNRPGARQRLLEARELAAGLGARPLLDRIGRLAGRARLDETLPAPTVDRRGLTRRELDVLRVLAKGRSNPEIAAELFISPNTVGTHLASIFAKLGVSTRTAATAAAYEAGLLG